MANDIVAGEGNHKFLGRENGEREKSPSTTFDDASIRSRNFKSHHTPHNCPITPLTAASSHLSQLPHHTPHSCLIT